MNPLARFRPFRRRPSAGGSSHVPTGRIETSATARARFGETDEKLARGIPKGGDTTARDLGLGAPRYRPPGWWR